MDLLVTLLLILVGAGVLFLLVALLAVLLGLRQLRRRNRVSPDAATTAPVSWLGAPSAPARLHRRLRTALSAVRTSAGLGPHDSRLAGLAADLEAEAVALDRQLVAVSRLSSGDRKQHLAPLADRVRQVEQAASQVTLLAAQAHAPVVAAGQPSALDDLAQQLDLLEQARAEVAEVEADAGLHRVSPFAEGEHRPGGPTASPG